MERRITTRSGGFSLPGFACAMHAAGWLICAAAVGPRPAHAWTSSDPTSPARASATPSMSVPRPSPAAHRFDEDWRTYCATVRAPRGVDRLKCLPLGRRTLASLGADLRLRVEAVHRPGFGLGQPSDRVALLRAMSHVDLRFGESLRIFTQVGAFEEALRERERAPTDRDRADLIQAFVDLDFGPSDSRLTLRGGRQEISLGSSRLVGVREGANERRTFVGARGIWRSDAARIDAIAARPMRVEPGPFDNGVDDDEALFGVHATTRIAGPLHADAYYLGYTRDDASFAAGTGDERRHSLGLRFFGDSGGIDWDVEVVGQVGQIGSLDIGAWTLASSFGYRFASLPLRPRLGLKADVASGDRHVGDGTLGTFNALYPRFPYFSEAILVVPANLVDLNFSLSVHPTGALTLELGWNPVWRYDTSDAVYAAPLEPVPGTAGEPGRFTAHQTILGFSWSLGPSLEVTGQYVHAVPANALRDVGGDPVDFGTVTFNLRL